MSSRYSDDKRTHHHHYRDEKDKHHRPNHYGKHESRSRSRSRSRSQSRSRSRSPPDYRHKHSSTGSSGSSGGGGGSGGGTSGSSSNTYNRNIHQREINSSNRNGLSSVYGRNDEHKSRDPDELVCPPPPVISKVSMSFGKPQPPKPVKLKLGASKPSEPVKKITVASAFSNNDSDDDDDEEEPPVKYSRNIGRDTPTSSGPNSFGKTKQGFCDVKKIFEKSLRDFNNE